jgi:hypothetical protein
MRYVRRFHLQAIFCGLAVLVCELISRPFTTMSVCDHGLYILITQTLARTGHIAYNGWAASMMVSQLYLAVVFIKLFGSSFTTVRMSTLLIAGPRRQPHRQSADHKSHRRVRPGASPTARRMPYVPA